MVKAGVQIIFIALAAGSFSKTYSQPNVVLNPSFEIHDTCPDFLSIPGNVQVRYCINWDCPTQATSDYFCSCSPLNAISVNVPNNFIGYQLAEEGNCYAGIIVYFYGANYKEYVQGKFSSPLVFNHRYEISFYTNLANDCEYACSKIGAYISTNAISSSSTYNLNVIPQIYNQSGFLTDTVSWVKIAGTYLAQGGENFITIGNFTDSLTADTLRIFSNTGAGISYYYVDGVETKDLTPSLPPINVPNVFTPNNDGINDVFYIEGIDFTDCQFSIYNRWGLKIYESNNTKIMWDGHTASGTLCTDGIYYFVLKVNNENKQGWIQLIK